MTIFQAFIAVACAVGVAGIAGVAWEAYSTRPAPKRPVTLVNVRDACGDGCTAHSTSMAHRPDDSRDDAEIDRRAARITARLKRRRANVLSR